MTWRSNKINLHYDMVRTCGKIIKQKRSALLDPHELKIIIGQEYNLVQKDSIQALCYQAKKAWKCSCTKKLPKIWKLQFINWRSTFWSSYCHIIAIRVWTLCKNCPKRWCHSYIVTPVKPTLCSWCAGWHHCSTVELTSWKNDITFCKFLWCESRWNSCE